jgi:hypothetical protein
MADSQPAVGMSAGCSHAAFSSAKMKSGQTALVGEPSFTASHQS